MRKIYHRNRYGANDIKVEWWMHVITVVILILMAAV